MTECMVGSTALLLDHLVPLAVVEGVSLEEFLTIEAAHQGVRIHTGSHFWQHAGVGAL